MPVSKVELEDVGESLVSGESILAGNVDVIRDLEVKLNVSLGESKIKVDELMSIKAGSVVKIDRDINTPLDIYINDKLVARGTMVVVDDNFGVQVSEING